MNRAEQDAMEHAVSLYLRFQQQKNNNNHKPGQCSVNDIKVYEIIDDANQNGERCFHLMEWLMLFAKDNKNWNKNLQDWCGEVLDRNPIHTRTQDERWKSTRNNHQMWMLMMQYQEEVTRRLEEGINENHSTFSQHFEFTKA